MILLRRIRSVSSVLSQPKFQRGGLLLSSEVFDEVCRLFKTQRKTNFFNAYVGMRQQPHGFKDHPFVNYLLGRFAQNFRGSLV